jgi:glycerol-3-phosphate dehydrogenase
MSMAAMASLDEFNKSSRPALCSRLASAPVDLLVIGGGITGACIFRDASMRGMKAALLEARDFAAGTSGRSSKLIHGGLRYLKTLGFRLARESCKERNLHIRLNKRLVRPMPFLMPLYRRGGESPALLRAGMLLYEALAGFRNHRFHRFLSREETLQMAPGIPVDGLIGGCLYYDAVVSDNRWTMENVKDGVRRGGLAINYAPVFGLSRENGRVSGASFRDELSGAEFTVRAGAVVNATGVFADRVRRMDDSSALPLIRLSKGTHLIFREEDVPLSVTTVFSSPVDGRPLFLVKHDGCFLYGTTDDWEDADPGAPAPGEKDVGYLIDSLARFMPEARLDRAKAQFVYSGFRPLLAQPASPDSRQTGAELRPSDATREDLVEESASGLISVMGGKLTTARIMAIRVLRCVMRRLGGASRWAACRTDRLSLGGTNKEIAEGLAGWVKQCPQLSGYFRVLYDRYGLDADAVCAEVLKIHQGRHPDPRAEPIRAEVEYVCRHEMVCTLEDLIDRRAGFLYWNPERRIERLRHGEHVIRKELDLSEGEFAKQLEDYQQRLARFHSAPA